MNSLFSKYLSRPRVDLLFFVPAICLLFQGCAEFEIPRSYPSTQPAIELKTAAGESSDLPESIESSSVQTPEKAEADSEPLVPYHAKTGHKRPGRIVENPFSKTDMVAVAVDHMTLSRFITYIFSDVLDSDFVIGPSIAKNQLDGPVTLSLQENISENRLFSIVVNVLAQHGIVIAGKDNVFFIAKDTGKKNIALGVGKNDQDVPEESGEINQLVPVQYADANNIIKFIPQSMAVQVFIVPGENMLRLKGPRPDVLRTLAMVRTIDRPAMRGRFIGSYELQYISTKDGIDFLIPLLKEEGIPVAVMAGENGVFLMPQKKRGLLIYFAAQKVWLSRIEYWLNFIDRPSKINKKEFHVYFPKNARASTLFESLQLIIAATSEEDEKSEDKKSDTKKKITPTKKVPEKSKIISLESFTDSTEDTKKNMSVIGDNVKLSVDENRNALIIYAVPEKYAMIRTLLEELDIIPTQVLIEASIVEVTLTDNLQYGLEWYLGLDGGSTILSTLGGLGLGAGGLDISIVKDSGNFQAKINALITDDRIELLSNPSIMVRNGKNASIVVGTEVPIIVSSQTSDTSTEGTSNLIQTVVYRSTGLSLGVTPIVHSKGVISLEISQELSEAQANQTSSIDSPIILNRSIETEVVALDGQTIILGGLIRENNSETVNKVPILGDIPVLGHLFKTTSIGGR